MKISYNWLKNYINLDLSVDKLSQILTDIGLEVEGIENFESVKGGLKGLVIGEIISKEKHPKADKLSLTKVNIGDEKLLDVVCGAPNVESGQKIVFAGIGTTLYQRILVLDNKAKVGTLAKDHFKIINDHIFEIGLTPNRIDAASHIGVARDLVAYFKQCKNIELFKPNVEKFSPETKNKISIEIENQESCPRYSGLTISNLEVKESPEWLKNNLKSIGLKPINNVVDITNFVLHETGQPLHAFDFDKIIGKKVIVKNLKKDTKFKTLDKLERNLSDEDLMICNSENGMCIAGVFGGIDSGVTEKTKNIFLESAYFNAVSVRKTAKRHQLKTDSSFRFERGMDPNNTIYPLKRAALLIKKMAGGEISEITDIYNKKIEKRKIKVSYKNISRLIGKTIEKNKIKNILNSLEIFILEENEENLILEVPTYRVDVTREADIIEEILRIYGYNNIEVSKTVKSAISYAPKIDDKSLKNKVGDLMANMGFNEMMSNSLTKSFYFEELESYKKENTVKILNPLSSDLDSLRQTLLFSGLETIKFNQNYKNFDLKLFEFGNSYFFDKENNSKEFIKNYFEKQNLSIFLSGKIDSNSWQEKEKNTNFFHLKNYICNIFQILKIDVEKLKLKEIKNDIFSYGLNFYSKKNSFVNFGLLTKKVCEKLNIETEVFYAEFEWDNLIKFSTNEVAFKEISKFPQVKRDLALLIDKNISFENIKNLAQKTEKKFLKKLNLFDIYEGTNLEKDKKSYAISFILQDENKTLNEKQIDKIMKKLISVFEKNLNAKIR
ncbi:MAG: phenylalanine--tRNA ligase subunit beta [Bacteroidetes bacterium 4572_128]|nr:MAG: phenylalanine--tRNA ligase subunit beta [Bacteroidetes bacterium 4572_128]